MKKKCILVILILIVIVVSMFMDTNSVKAQSTNEYSISIPDDMGHKEIDSSSDLYYYEDNEDDSIYGISISTISVNTLKEEEELYDKYKDILNADDYEAFLKQFVDLLINYSYEKIEIDDSKFVRIGEENYKTICIEFNTEDDDFDSIRKEYILLSDNNVYKIDVVGSKSNIKKLNKILNTFEVKDTISYKGVVGVNRTLVIIFICVCTLIILAIIIIVIILVIQKNKNDD